MRVKRDILTLELRQKIYNYILKHPGLYQSEISRSLKIPKSTLIYHLSYMKKNKILTSKNFEGHNKYYINDKIGTKEKEILELLRRETPRRIILCLKGYIFCSQKEISKILELHPTTVEFHLKKLLDLGIIENIPYENDNALRGSYHIYKRKRISNEKIYCFKSPEIGKIIQRLLIKYQYSLKDKKFIKAINDFRKEVIIKFYINGRFPSKKVNTVNMVVDSLIKDTFKFVRPPFMA